MEQICPGAHKHALTHTCYGHGCRCTPCRTAHATQARTRRKQQAYGRFDHGMIPAEPIRAHIIYLRANGMGVKRIAAMSGVHAATIGAIMWGRSGNPPGVRVKRVNAEPILRVQPALDDLAAGAMIDPTPTRRRLQALARIGWTWRSIAVEAGMDERRIPRFLDGQYITAGNARIIRDLYSRLWDKPPTSSNRHVAAKIRAARLKAELFGWTGPMGWDDIDTDEEPADIIPNQPGKTWVLDELEHLRALGESPDSAAVALGSNPGTMASLAYRHGRPEIARWIERVDREERKAS